MDHARLTALLDGCARARVLVAGDFFLDRYLVIDPALAERSLETGRVAHQVVDVVAAPGAAGTVAANLCALGATVLALGLLGDDGEGYELRRGLRAGGVDDRAMVTVDGWRTPTYTKPIVRSEDGDLQELERLDIRTRAPTLAAVVDRLIVRLRDLAAQVDAVVIADQLPEAERGTITTAMREELARLARQYPQTWFLADSRERIGAFSDVIVKPNMAECVRAIDPGAHDPPDMDRVRRAGIALQQRTGRPVFVTLGSAGMLVITGTDATHVPGMNVSGPIDVVGAGDSAMSAIAAGLCAGADLTEAALLGNIAAAVTIQQLGTTGTASPRQIAEQWLRGSAAPTTGTPRARPRRRR